MFLYEKDHSTLNTFVSKSSTGASKIYNGKEYMYSSKYLNLISHTLEIFEQLFGTFKSIPHTVVRKEFAVTDYSNDVGDHKSIEWLFQNLDSIDFDYSYKNHPDGMALGSNFGVVDKIGVDRNISSYSTYENGIILGAFEYVKFVLSDIEEIVQIKIDENTKGRDEPVMQYVDFRDLKVIPFIKLLTTIEDLKRKLEKLNAQYSSIFNDARPINKFHKLSPVFQKFRHYQKAFLIIRDLRVSKYDLAGEIQLLNVKRLSQLYEMFNLHCIIDCCDNILLLDSYQKEIFYEEEGDQIDYIAYISSEGGKSIRIFYTPKITAINHKLDLITIGNVLINGDYCCPDFVIEIKDKNSTRYCILDAKYSKISTVSNQYLTPCIKKYILDLGIKNAPYQKPDFLVLLHPDSTDDERDLIYNPTHYPQIGTVISKPKNFKKLTEIIKMLVLKIEH
jgi:hypothetical protein